MFDVARVLLGVIAGIARQSSDPSVIYGFNKWVVRNLVQPFLAKLDFLYEG